MAASSLTIRIDSTLKERASRVLDHYGLDLSTATRAFFTQIVNTNSVPLSFDYEEPNEESIVAMQEADEMRKTGDGTAYSSGRELIEAALA